MDRSHRCLEGIYGMSEQYVRCLDVSEGQVRSSQVWIGKISTGKIRTGQVRTVQVKEGQGMHLRLEFESSNGPTCSILFLDHYGLRRN